jgi:hypothetical protein
LGALWAGSPLGQAAAVALTAYSGFDLGAGLTTLIESGACASARLGERS